VVPFSSPFMVVADKRISLVTPSFQQGRFLRACIESVLTQEGASFEFAVFDGGSSDGSVGILRSYGEAFFWRTRPDKGQAAAVNEGLQRSGGEILGYLNSDDFLAPGTLGRVAEFFDQHPNVDVLYGDADIVDSEGRVIRRSPTQPFDKATLIEHCFICQPAAFWRRLVHEKFGWFDTSFPNTFDYEFWLRLACGGAKFAYLPETLASSREHPDTKSQRHRAQIFSEIRRLELRHLGYCGRNWWEQQLRFWRDETDSPWARLLPGRKDQRMYRLAWWPYVLWRRRLGGPLFYKPGHWRA
jgi:glycosyltransferase involved in cell wall biosynthesis